MQNQFGSAVPTAKIDGDLCLQLFHPKGTVHSMSTKKRENPPQERNRITQLMN